MSERDPQEQVDEQSAQDVTELDGQDGQVVQEHADNWNNTPPGENVPEWLRRRNDDEDTAAEAGDA
ncbi:hypothetical protein [Aestuariimicrobium ganziense]|uniref:hypothetical protein n=1 Tax=Aestuariimicrobium ganziense TaxID=2773677 RepID=UPI001942614E|nr:hypothetical protein [Aestuariimicrobium ganziense]